MYEQSSCYCNRIYHWSWMLITKVHLIQFPDSVKWRQNDIKNRFYQISVMVFSLTRSLFVYNNNFLEEFLVDRLSMATFRLMSLFAVIWNYVDIHRWKLYGCEELSHNCHLNHSLFMWFFCHPSCMCFYRITKVNNSWCGL